MKKAHYFSPEKFIDDVLKDMNLGSTTPEMLLALREEIELCLSERIINTIVDSFGKKELDLFAKVLEDHPKLDEIDALMMLAPEVDGLKEKLDAEINSLYSELVYDAQQIHKHMKPAAA